MPAGSKEKLHYHEKAQQFFYIVSDIATFEIYGLICSVGQNRGILIRPDVKHMILNNTDSDLEFIVVSEPNSHSDRVNIGS